MEKKIFTYQTLIREFHLDTFGHVNNAMYMQLYEEARWDFITQVGFGLEKVQRDQVGPVVLDALIKYRKELKLRETIKIETAFVSQPHRLTFILEQFIKNEAGQIASSLSITLGIMDFKTRKLMIPPEDWLKAMGA